MSKEVKGIAGITFAHCLRCGRKLHAAASISRGYGRGCRARILAAAKLTALAGFTADQIAKARELVEDGGITRIRRGIYRVVSSDGLRTYLTSVAGPCNCPHGLRARSAKPCFHVATARIVSA